MGQDLQRVQNLGVEIAQLRQDMEVLGKMVPQVEALLGHAHTLETATVEIDLKMKDVTSSVNQVNTQAKKIIDMKNQAGGAMNKVQSFF